MTGANGKRETAKAADGQMQVEEASIPEMPDELKQIIKEMG